MLLRIIILITWFNAHAQCMCLSGCGVHECHGTHVKVRRQLHCVGGGGGGVI